MEKEDLVVAWLSTQGGTCRGAAEKSCRLHPSCASDYVGTSGLCSRWRSERTSTGSDPTSQGASSNPQWPATPLSRGRGSLGKLEYPAFAEGRKQLQTEPLLLGELLVLPGLLTIPSGHPGRASWKDHGTSGGLLLSTGTSPVNGGLSVSPPHLSRRLISACPSCLHTNVQNTALGWLQVYAVL